MQVYLLVFENNYFFDLYHSYILYIPKIKAAQIRRLIKILNKTLIIKPIKDIAKRPPITIIV